MIGYIKSTVVFISQLKGAVHPLVLTDQGISKPPPVLSFITLITYLLSFTLALSCPWLALAYLSLHLTALVCWLINTITTSTRTPCGEKCDLFSSFWCQFMLKLGGFRIFLQTHISPRPPSRVEHFAWKDKRHRCYTHTCIIPVIGF